MVETLIKAVGGILLVTVGWLFVQAMLARANRTPAGQDPLAERLRCTGCCCNTECERHR